MTFESVVEWVIRAIEIAGVAVLVSGSLIALVTYARDLQQFDRIQAYTNMRQNIGRTILLGLEILIVADIVLTVAIDSTLQSAVALGVIVLVRTFLSFSLEIELDGVVPWRRRAAEREAAREAALDAATSAGMAGGTTGGTAPLS